MKRVMLIALLLSFLAVPLSAGQRKPSLSVPIVNYVVQDTNRWEIYQDFGRFVIPLPGSKPGAYWPKYSGRNYIYGAGIWVGAMDTTDLDTVIVRGYDCGAGGTAWGPCLPNGDTTGAMTDSLARTYRSDIPRDTAQWPERDSSGRAIIKSDQELWTIASGLDPLDSFSAPFGVTALRRSLAWNSPGPWGDITEMEVEVKNVTGRWQGRPRTLKKMIVGFNADADIGNESGTNANDLCFVSPSGGGTYPDLAVQYQLAQEPGWSPPGPPYYVGFKFVSGPVNNTSDTIQVRSQPSIGYPQYDHDILPGQPLGMTAFQIFTISVDPSTSWDCYMELTGRYYKTPTILNSYEYDGFGPCDLRFVMACGPFDLPNDSTAKFVFRIIGASDSTDLMYKAGLVGVESPSHPGPHVATGTTLYEPAPNPSSGPCLIRYSLPEPSQAALKIYDISGRLVRELDRGEKPAGEHSLSWDCKDGSGKKTPGGVYFLHLETKNSVQTRRFVVIR